MLLYIIVMVSDGRYRGVTVTILDLDDVVVDGEKGHLIVTHHLTDYSICIGDIMKDITSDREDSEQLLRLIFTSYITCDESYTKQQLQIMIIRLQAIEEAATTAIASSSLLHHHRPLTSIESLILRLHSQYPSDIGVFSPLLMNYIVLQKGHSFFIGANELHAYISGEWNLPPSLSLCLLNTMHSFTTSTDRQ